MYVSNENATLVDVYFDDKVMTHTKGNVVQYNEYYPFGLQTANSWTRESNTGNNFLANGGTELNTTSNLYDLQYRNYDPVLGRMNQVDPMATKYASLSPYNFSFNDPVYYNDISGADPNQDSGLKEWMRESNARSDRDFNNFFNPNYMYGIVGDDDLKNPNRFGAGYLPGEFDGSGRLGQEYNVYERWEDTYTNGRLTDSKFIGLRFEEKYSKRDQTRGVPTINQVLEDYGYNSREDYLFPKPSFLERALPFLSGDILEGVVESVTAESDRINQNLKSVDIDKLKLFRADLFTLRYNLMTKVEKLEAKYGLLRANNLCQCNYGEMSALTTKVRDINNELVPINDEINILSYAISHKEVH